MKVLSTTDLGFPDKEALFAEVITSNSNFDGRFFVGVSSTGIYCRTVCSAKTPRHENCTFFPTAAAAEAAGYRPCLKCRPELAPDTPATIGMASIPHRAAELIKESSTSRNIAQIADELGVSERQLRRVFEDEYGVSPAAYRNTCRLLFAKSLLTDTDMPITHIAYSCGFSSVRRFNDAFSHQYRMPPSHLRNRAPVSKAEPHPIVLRVDYRPPFRFDLLLEFLSLRAIEGVEAVKGDTYCRTVKLESSQMGQAGGQKPRPPTVGWIKVANHPQKNCLKVTVSPELFSELPLVMVKVRRLFDVDCLPQTVEEGLADFYGRVPKSRIPGIRIPCCFDGFEMAVRAILGQQVTVKAANTMAGRVARAFGSPVSLPVEELTTAFPSPLAFCSPDAIEKLGSLGVVRQRARAICALAEAICSGELDIRPGTNIEEAAASLIAIPGIGDWTVQYLLMRAFDYTDAFPTTDLGVKSAFPDKKEKEIKEFSKLWSPWRSYAVMSLWCTPHEKPNKPQKPHKQEKESDHAIH